MRISHLRPVADQESGGDVERVMPSISEYLKSIDYII